MASHHDFLEKNLTPVEKSLQPYFLEKAPFQLPNGLKEFLAKIAPWLIIILVVLTIPSIFTLFGLSSYLGGLPMQGYNLGITYTIFGIISIVVIILEALAVPGLMKRSIKGWRLLFAATIVGVLSNLIIFNLVGFVLGFVISFYILFQLKPLYK